MADLNTAEGDEVGFLESNSPQAKRESNDTGHCEHPNEQLSNLKSEVNGLHKMFEEEFHEVNNNMKEVTHQVNTMQRNMKEITHQVHSMQKNMKEVTHQVNTMQKNMKEVTHQVNTMQKNVEDQTKLLFVEVKKAIEHSNDAYDAMASRYNKLEMEVLNAKKGSPDVCLIGASASPIFKGKAKEGNLRTQSADEITDLSIEIDDGQTTKGNDDKNELVDDASPLKCGNRDSGITDDAEQQSPILSHLRDYAERSTMHGVLRLFIYSRNLRMFWAILLISALGISTWQFVGIFHNYFEYPVYVDITVENEPPAFPHILLCPANLLVKKRALFQHPVLKNVTRNFTTSRSSWWYEASRLPKDDLIQLGFTADEFMRVYDDTLHKDRKKYTPTRVLVPERRICYSVDFQENRQVRELRMLLSANNHESVNIRWPFIYDHFVDLYLLPEYKATPYQLQRSTTIQVKVNTLTSIKFQLEKYNRLNGVYGKCQDDEDSFRKRTGFNYTRSLCESECLFIHTMKKCKCYIESPFFPHLGVQHPDFSGFRNCYNVIKGSRCFIDSLYKAIRPLDCQCKARCQKSIYAANSGEYDLNSGSSRQDFCAVFDWPPPCFFNNTRIEWVRENIAQVTITHSKHSYKEFTQKPLYPFSRFISDIGGTLGFYCGSSVLTVFEVIQLVLALMVYLFSSIRARYQA